jgi:hypothetical protein
VVKSCLFEKFWSNPRQGTLKAQYGLNAQGTASKTSHAGSSIQAQIIAGTKENKSHDTGN